MHDRKLGVTLFRSPIYGDGDFCGNPTQVEDDHDIISKGVNDGMMRICLDYMTSAAAYTAAEAFENPHIVICEADHGSNLAHVHSWLSLEAAHCHLSTVKMAEDGNGLVFRIPESNSVSKHINTHIVFFTPVELLYRVVSLTIYD